ncbi:DUF413 domain-containing protein [Paraglaciecola sp. 20A4]|uniref:DUF413 domain-containing protein n=1 Tax=Paraglaciecola sp. 20A4 TaxID=2687288 RepID=UPI00140A30B6|nr:DUF413 domain-containing protein [Paraglaciecola sp. 20A4]
MAKLSRESLFQRVFSDPKNYPYGFSRSGDFSISESRALSQYGCLIAALVDGQIEPECDEDNSLLASAKGEKNPSTVAEKAWYKYDKRIHRPKLGNIYGSRPVPQGDDDDISEDSEVVIELDD